MPLWQCRKIYLNDAGGKTDDIDNYPGEILPH
jgi:hypothetical protein